MSISGIRPSFPGRTAPKPPPASLSPTEQAMGDFLDACGKGNMQEINWFLKYYPTQWGCHRAGKIGLMYAAENGHNTAVKALLDAGSSINAQDKTRACAMLYAAMNGHLETVKILHESKGFFRADETGMTPAHFAAMNGHAAVLEFVMNAAPKQLELPDNAGMTPLCRAVVSGKEACVRLLLDRGAKLNVEGEGKDLVSLALSRGHFEVADMVKAEPARRDAEITATVDGGISGDLTLRSPFKLVQKKPAPEKPSAGTLRGPQAQREAYAALAKITKPIFP